MFHVWSCAIVQLFIFGWKLSQLNSCQYSQKSKKKSDNNYTQKCIRKVNEWLRQSLLELLINYYSLKKNLKNVLLLWEPLFFLYFVLTRSELITNANLKVSYCLLAQILFVEAKILFLFLKDVSKKNENLFLIFKKNWAIFDIFCRCPLYNFIIVLLNNEHL